MKKTPTKTYQPFGVKDEHSELTAKITYSNQEDKIKADICIGVGLQSVDYEAGRKLYLETSDFHKLVMSELT